MAYISGMLCREQATLPCIWLLVPVLAVAADAEHKLCQLSALASAVLRRGSQPQVQTVFCNARR